MNVSVDVFLTDSLIVRASGETGTPVIHIQPTGDNGDAIRLFTGSWGQGDSVAAAISQLRKFTDAMVAAVAMLPEPVEPTPGPDEPDDEPGDEPATIDCRCNAFTWAHGGHNLDGSGLSHVMGEKDCAYADDEPADEPAALTDSGRLTLAGAEHLLGSKAGDDPAVETLRARSYAAYLNARNPGEVDRSVEDAYSRWLAGAVRPLDEAPETESELRAAYGDR